MISVASDKTVNPAIPYLSCCLSRKFEFRTTSAAKHLKSLSLPRREKLESYFRIGHVTMLLFLICCFMITSD